MGAIYLDKFFKLLDWTLRPDRAVAVITATTQPEWRFKILQCVVILRCVDAALTQS